MLSRTDSATDIIQTGLAAFQERLLSETIKSKVVKMYRNLVSDDACRRISFPDHIENQKPKSFFLRYLHAGSSNEVNWSLVARIFAEIRPIVLSEFNKDESPFWICFENAASILESELGHIIKKYAIDVSAAARVDIIQSFVFRCINISKYVLYTEFKRSKCSYSDWVKKFRTEVSRNSQWIEIFNEYPILLRSLFNCWNHFLFNISNIFERFSNDKNLIGRLFDVSSSARIERINLDLSDPHRGGQTVAKIEFSDGSILFYKPKPVEIEYYFNKFIRDSKMAFGFSNIRVLPRRGYGWAEDALRKHAPGRPHAADIGHATALFWALNAADMHNENVAVRRDGIVGLDLEMLLTAQVDREAIYGTHDWRDHSITSTLLFESTLKGSPAETGYSGFGANRFKKNEYSEVEFAIYDDEIILKEFQAGKKFFAEDTSQPNGSKYSRSIIENFSLSAGEILVSSESFLNSLDKTTNLRFVLRPTSFYFQLLKRLKQPVFMRDADLTFKEINQLYKTRNLFKSIKSDIDLIIEDEISQLLNGDIPYFFREAGGIDLYTSKSRIPGFFSQSGLEFSRRKIQNSTEVEISEQRALLSVALGVPKIGLKDIYPSTCKSDSNLHISATIGDICNELEIGAARLINSAFVGKDELARWVCIPGGVDSDNLRVSAGDTGFFAGSLGVLTALQAIESTLVGKVATEYIGEFLDRQVNALESHFSNIVRCSYPVYGSLGLSGLGGDIMAIAILSRLAPIRWNSIAPLAGDLLASQATEIENDRWIDVIGGSAGLILGCCHVILSGNHEASKIAAREIVRRCAKRLITSTDQFEGYPVWVVPNERLPLIGYAHGWAGIVSALVSAIDLFDSNDRFRMQILEVLERSIGYVVHKKSASDTWLDYRGSFQNEVRFEEVNSSWCNGTAGIARGLKSVHELKNHEIDTAYQSILRDLSARYDIECPSRFCCGELGGIDTLIDFPEIFISDGLDEKLKLKVYQRLRSLRRNFTNEEMMKRPEVGFPSLYQGYSGIYYTAARVLNKFIPSLSGQLKNDAPKLLKM